jgi:hypothetical protein
MDSWLTVMNRVLILDGNTILWNFRLVLELLWNRWWASILRMTLLTAVRVWSAVVHFLFCSVRSSSANIDTSLNSLQCSRLRSHFHLTFIKFCYRAAEELSRMFGVEILNKMFVSAYWVHLVKDSIHIIRNTREESPEFALELEWEYMG